MSSVSVLEIAQVPMRLQGKDKAPDNGHMALPLPGKRQLRLGKARSQWSTVWNGYY